MRARQPLSVLLILSLVLLVSSKIHFIEEFNDDPFTSGRWVLSKWKVDSGLEGKFELGTGEFFNDKKIDQGLMTSQDSKYFTATATFPSITNKDKTLVFQFQTKNTQNVECGGSYLKLGPKISDQTKFTGDTAYSIMFGPDQCGSSTRKTHLIFSYKGKNLDRKRDIELKNDNLSHLYTLVLKSDNTYEVYIDSVKSASGSLFDDWNFLLPKKIKDPKLSKPSDWVDVQEIDDPEDVKPEGWVEEKQIKDPSAAQPEDWDTEEDGEWSAPLIENPKYKGEWKAKRIPNPAYKGEWVHPEIDNPEYSEDSAVYLFPDISMVSIDVWQVKGGTVFDNIVIADSKADADEVAERTFSKLQPAETKQKEAKDKKSADEAAAAAAKQASSAKDTKEEKEEEELEEEEEKNVRDEL